MNIKNTRIKRQTRIRKNIVKITVRPRLSVFRSNRYIYAQIIDKTGDTILGMSEKVLLKRKNLPAGKQESAIERARDLGREIAKLAIDKKIKEVVFDKGRFSYHGKVEAVAIGAREGGLKF